MKHFFSNVIMILAGIFMTTASLNAMEVTEFKLENGLTVILNPNPDASEVFGVVAVKAGSYNEPADATGLAHYLEHVIFKGTQEMGTTNWEAEKPLYDQIIQKFEEQRKTSDEAERKRIVKEINELSIEAGKYTVLNDFAGLVQGMGGSGLNAGTSYDYTVYYNTFPPFQLERWLELYAHRFQNLVFRGFQAELENVYEEKNMYADQPSSVMNELRQKSVFGDESPYGRSIIGYSEHLKNPSLKSLIEFYDTYYVASNMALVLSGDFDATQAKAIIERTFSTWETKEVPDATVYPVKKYDGKEVVKVKSSSYPIGFWSYNTVASGDDDEMALEVLAGILSNSNQTGLLDKLSLDGDLLMVQSFPDVRKHAGNITIVAVPTFDLDTYKFNSILSAEKQIHSVLEDAKEGEFEDWLLQSVKEEMLMNFEIQKETPQNSGMGLAQLFLLEEGIDYIEEYPKMLNAVTKEQVIAVAKKYLGDDYLEFYSLEGEMPDEEMIEKPDIKPIVPSSGQASKFAEYLEKVPVGEKKGEFVDFQNDVKKGSIAEGVTLYHAKNPMNDIFSIGIKFGVGSKQIPEIGMATSLMNSAGVMALYEPQELKEEFSKLGCGYSFANDDSYTYVNLYGKEENLEAACKLLAKLYLMPAMDEKQVDRIIGSALSNRYTEKRSRSSQYNALINYIRYGKESPQIDRMSREEIEVLTLSSLAAKFIEATKYETSVHYAGSKSFEELTEVLNRSLPFPSGLKPSQSPYIRPIASPEERNIYFINNSDATQSTILLFAKGDDYTQKDKAILAAFNQYFSGGFNGLVMQELRELRSFAYSAGASYVSPILDENPTYFLGSIGTQNDKAADALREFLVLIDEMPQKPERINNIKHYLEQTAMSSKPDFRSMSSYVEIWEMQGYVKDPNMDMIPLYNELTFDDITSFYESKLKGRNLSIAIFGNKKEIDMDALEALAEIEKVPLSKIFSN